MKKISLIFGIMLCWILTAHGVVLEGEGLGLCPDLDGDLICDHDPCIDIYDNYLCEGGICWDESDPNFGLAIPCESELEEGKCGSADGDVFELTPTQDLCENGAASQIAWNVNTQRYEWTCSGEESYALDSHENIWSFLAPKAHAGSSSNVRCSAFRKIRLPFNRKTANMNALLIGVGDYPGRSADLIGPESDLEIIKNMLNSFGFQKNGNSIVRLKDSRAKQDRILRYMDKLSGESKRGKKRSFFAYFSGHGGEDGNLVSYDVYKGSGFFARLFGNDRIKGIDESKTLKPEQVNQVIDPSVKNYMFVDACFAGLFGRRLNNVNFIGSSTDTVSWEVQGSATAQFTQYEKAGLFTQGLAIAMASGTEQSLRQITQTIQGVIGQLRFVVNKQVDGFIAQYQAGLDHLKHLKATNGALVGDDREFMLQYYLSGNPNTTVIPSDETIIDWGISAFTEVLRQQRKQRNSPQNVSIKWSIDA